MRCIFPSALLFVGGSSSRNRRNLLLGSRSIARLQRLDRLGAADQGVRLDLGANGLRSRENNQRGTRSMSGKSYAFDATGQGQLSATIHQAYSRPTIITEMLEASRGAQKPSYPVLTRQRASRKAALLGCPFL